MHRLKRCSKTMKPMYLTMKYMLLGWLVGRLQNEAKSMFWRVVVAATIGGFGTKWLGRIDRRENFVEEL